MSRWMCHKCGSVDPIPEPDACPICHSWGYGCDCIIPEFGRCPNCREDNDTDKVCDSCGYPDWWVDNNCTACREDY